MEELEMLIKDLQKSIKEKKNTLEVRQQFQEYFEDKNTNQLSKEIQLGQKVLIKLEEYSKLKEALTKAAEAL